MYVLCACVHVCPCTIACIWRQRTTSVQELVLSFHQSGFLGTRTTWRSVVNHVMKRDGRTTLPTHRSYGSIYEELLKWQNLEWAACRWVVAGVTLLGAGSVWRRAMDPTIPAMLSDLSHPLSMPGLCFLPSEDIAIQVPHVLSPVHKHRWGCPMRTTFWKCLFHQNVLSAQGKGSTINVRPWGGGWAGLQVSHPLAHELSGKPHLTWNPLLALRFRSLTFINRSWAFLKCIAALPGLVGSCRHLSSSSAGANSSALQMAEPEDPTGGNNHLRANCMAAWNQLSVLSKINAGRGSSLRPELWSR